MGSDGIDVYIPHHKYQVKPHSSPWFSAACTATIVHRNHFFCCKVQFRQASNHCKRVLEATKLAYANKTKEPNISQELGSQDFWQIANSVFNKVKSAISLLFNSQKMLLSVFDKSKLFAKNFFKNSDLDDSGISLPVFPSRTNLKLHSISVSHKILTNLDLLKACSPDCIPVVVLKNCEPELSSILHSVYPPTLSAGEGG